MPVRAHPLGAPMSIAVGRGAIDRSGFAAPMRDERFMAIPRILETPKGENDEWDRINLSLLRELAGED